MSLHHPQGDLLMTVRDLSKTVDKQHILWQGISFDICRGSILFVRGPSGVGKTLLLRTLACLDPVEGGCMRLLGKTPSEVGIPGWRAQVLYVHQQRVSYPGSPLQLYERVQAFASHKSRGDQGPGPAADLVQIVEQMGLDQGVLSQQWSQLSGGQAQRVALAISICLRPQVILLDEPTSACDSEATKRVEAVMRSVASNAAVIWVTHDDLQPQRVGGQMLSLPTGVLSTIDSSQMPSSSGSFSSMSASSSSSQLAANSSLLSWSAGHSHSTAPPPPQAAWREEAAAKA